MNSTVEIINHILVGYKCWQNNEQYKFGMEWLSKYFVANVFDCSEIKYMYILYVAMFSLDFIQLIIECHDIKFVIHYQLSLFSLK